MIVELVARTQLCLPSMLATGYQMHDTRTQQADELGEVAGRECYLSFARPNPETATNEAYLANIIRQRHFSVFEHASVTLFVRGVSRSLLLELERHRFLSFSAMSQRYVDESEASFIEPPAIGKLKDKLQRENDNLNTPQAVDSWISQTVNDALETYRVLFQRLESAGFTRKQAREAARSVLPNGTETQFLVTGNLRAWREVIEKRTAVDENGTPFADAEMFSFARKALEIMKSVAPNTFQDYGGHRE